ncbi:MAG: hypothetical protein IPP81_19195 [Chitinophagaceae bacterium]|nr:hypothetical protein [Chitinophagaceae bacterium]
MTKILICLLIMFSFLGCHILNNDEKEAIEVCQKAKPEGLIFGISNSTWLDYANSIAKEDPNKKYVWQAKKSFDNKYFIVDFADSNGWGQHWEVDIEQKIVKNINQNEYLTRKYGYRRFDGNDEFEVINLKQNEMKTDFQNGYWNNENMPSIVYIIKGSVINKTNISITNATISGGLKLIFKEKTINGNANYESGFKSQITINNPWEPNTTREFFIKTRGIDKIYLGYIPEYVIFNVSLKATDPIGYSFYKDIVELDLKEKWKSFKLTSAPYSPNINTNENVTPIIEKNEDINKHEDSTINSEN